MELLASLMPTHVYALLVNVIIHNQHSAWRLATTAVQLWQVFKLATTSLLWVVYNNILICLSVSLL